MLDVDSPRPTQPVRSMLDVDGPRRPAVTQVLSNPSSPTDSNLHAHIANQSVHPRSLSDAAARPAELGPWSSGSRPDPTSEYQFSDIITRHVAPLPKRVSQGGKRSKGSMAQALRGNDVSGLILSGDRGRHYTVAGPSSRNNNKSKSPQNRLDVRSNSPHNNSLLSGRHLSPSGKQTRGDNQTVEYQNAYRHLSDANLARAGGSLSELSRRKRSDDAASLGRLEKDYMSPDGELLPDDSSDEDDGTSSDDEGGRGRKAARNSDSGSSQSQKSSRKTRSLMEAAEEERTCAVLSSEDFLRD